MTEQNVIKSALKKLKDQKHNFGMLERFDVDENWEVTNILEKQIPQEVVNQNGTPVMGYCPRCNEQITKSSSPVGCKWCLQRLKWEGEQNE